MGRSYYNSDAQARLEALRESQFEDKQQNEQARLGLSEQAHQVAQANAIREAVVARAKLQQEYRQNITAAAATWRLNQLDPTSSSFEKDYHAVLSNYGTALKDEGVRSMAKSIYDQHVDYGKAQTPGILGNKIASATFDAIHAATGSVELAKNYAENVVNQHNEAKKLVGDPNVSTAVKTNLTDVLTGKIVGSQAEDIVNQAGIQHSIGEQIQKKGEANASMLEKFQNTLKASGIQIDDVGKKDPKDRTPAEQMAWDTQYNILQAAKNATGQIAGVNQPATTTPTTATSKYVAEAAQGAKPSATAPAGTPAAAPQKETPPAPDITPENAALGEQVQTAIQPTAVTPENKALGEQISGLPSGEKNYEDYGNAGLPTKPTTPASAAPVAAPQASAAIPGGDELKVAETTAGSIFGKGFDPDNPLGTPTPAPTPKPQKVDEDEVSVA